MVQVQDQLKVQLQVQLQVQVQVQVHEQVGYLAVLADSSEVGGVKAVEVV